MARKQSEASFKEFCEKTSGTYSERDARFFNLRSNGYSGPIDQDGNAVKDDTGIFAELNRQSRIHGVPGY